MATSEPCPDPGLLDELASGEIAAAARPGLERHLDVCPSCSSVVAELARVYGSHVVPASGSVQARSQPPTRTAPLFATVGRYRIVDRIGEGGMGVVYVAHDPELDRRLALKLLRPEPDAAAEDRRTRLLVEAQAMAKLSHPNVVTVHDVGRVGEQLFIAMELVEGTTLSVWLARDRPGRGAVLRVLADAGRGLAAAHGAGLVHRDFKPDNVLVAHDGRVRVTDFGLARASGPVTLSDEPLDVTGPTRPLAMTAAGMLVGTPAYLAPEQWRGHPADARSDQFSFAVTLYEALFGLRPFEGATVRELASRVTAGEQRPMPPAPRWLRTLLARALANRPEDRFPSMTDLLGELDRDRGRARRFAASLGGMMAGSAIIVLGLHLATRGSGSVEGSLGAASPSNRADRDRAGAPDPCEAEEALALGGWSDARRDHVLRSAPTSAKDTGERLIRRMAAAARALADGRVAACRRKSDGLAVARSQCLADRQRAFEGLATAVDALADPGPRKWTEAVALTYALPQVELCADDEYLRARGAAFSVGEQPEVERLLQDVARLRPLTAFDAWEDVDRIEERVLRDADSFALKIKAPAALAEGLFAIGLYREGRRHAEETGDRLHEAFLSAKTAKDAELEALSAARLARYQIREPMDLREAERWVIAAEARAASLAVLAVPQSEALLARAEVERARGLPQKAIAALERAMKLREGALGAQHPDVAALDLLHAELLLEVGDARAALVSATRGKERCEEALGATNLLSAAHARGVGAALLALGRADEALAVLEAARDLERDLAPIFSVTSARTYDLLAAVDLAKGDLDGAEARVTLGEQQRRNAPRVEGRELAISRAVHADVLGARGQARAAVRERESVVIFLEAFHGAGDPRVALARLPLARAMARAGDAGAALAELDRGLASLSETLGGASTAAAWMRVEKGLVLLEQGRAKGKQALALLDGDWVALTTAYGPDSARLDDLLVARAEASLAAGDAEQARRLLGSAARRLAEHRGAEHPDTKSLEARLAALP